MDDLKQHVREIPDYPKPGILFYDITTLLANPWGLRTTVDRLVERFRDEKVDKVVGMESRGFLFGPSLAYNLDAGFVPVRKPGKLPSKVISETYDLEYGTDTLEMHADGIEAGERVLIVDDLIATGGTARATAKLVEAVGGEVAGFGFVIELTFLNGRDQLKGYDIESLLQY